MASHETMTADGEVDLKRTMKTRLTQMFGNLAKALLMKGALVLCNSVKKNQYTFLD
jgi:hypothetical protein